MQELASQNQYRQVVGGDDTMHFVATLGSIFSLGVVAGTISRYFIAYCKWIYVLKQEAIEVD